jgi:hypothetical protein
MDKLHWTESFAAHKDKEEMSSYTSRMLLWIQDKLWFPLSQRVNWLLDRTRDGFHEITDEDTDVDEDGNWRLQIVGDNLEVQKKVAGAWTTVDTFVP